MVFFLFRLPMAIHVCQLAEAWTPVVQVVKVLFVVIGSCTRAMNKVVVVMWREGWWGEDEGESVVQRWRKEERKRVERDGGEGDSESDTQGQLHGLMDTWTKRKILKTQHSITHDSTLQSTRQMILPYITDSIQFENVNYSH